MLTGQAKTDYQREYMRKRRSNKRAESVRPSEVAVLDPVEQLIDRNQSEQGYLACTPLAELEAKGAWIPNWRREQGHNP